jgi:hypothetical protein
MALRIEKLQQNHDPSLIIFGVGLTDGQQLFL